MKEVKYDIKVQEGHEMLTLNTILQMNKIMKSWFGRKIRPEEC